MSARLTREEMAVRKKYTRIESGNLWLKIDHQSFEIVAGKPVGWFRKQLAVALTRLINRSERNIK